MRGRRRGGGKIQVNPFGGCGSKVLWFFRKLLPDFNGLFLEHFLPCGQATETYHWKCAVHARALHALALLAAAWQVHAKVFDGGARSAVHHHQGQVHALTGRCMLYAGAHWRVQFQGMVHARKRQVHAPTKRSAFCWQAHAPAQARSVAHASAFGGRVSVLPAIFSSG